MAFPSPSGPNSSIWKLKDVWVANSGDNWPDASFDRACFAGGSTPASNTNVIEFLTLASSGNAADFGDLTVTRSVLAAGQSNSKTRGLFAAGYANHPGPGNINTIEFITINTTGNATDFGDLLYSPRGAASLSSSTRGIVSGGVGNIPSQGDGSNYVFENINFITIATTGNASDFGNLATDNAQAAGVANSTRGLFGGGYSIPPPHSSRPSKDIVEYITIASTGNSLDFGDLSSSKRLNQGMGSTTRALIGSGSLNPGSHSSNVIDYFTIASTGNATDFGDLVANYSQGGGAADNNTTGVFAGGSQSPTGDVNVIQSVTIASTGNASDFGDLTVAGHDTGGSVSSQKASGNA